MHCCCTRTDYVVQQDRHYSQPTHDCALYSTALCCHCAAVLQFSLLRRTVEAYVGSFSNRSYPYERVATAIIADKTGGPRKECIEYRVLLKIL